MTPESRESQRIMRLIRLSELAKQMAIETDDIELAADFDARISRLNYDLAEMSKSTTTA